MYIDDGISAFKSESHLVATNLEKEGFVLNVKCCLESCQTDKWVGFIVNLLEGKFHVAQCKLDKLKASSVRVMLQLDRVKVCVLANAVGQIISISLVMSPIARLRKRALCQKFLS